MSTERAVRLLAGSLVAAGLGLAWLASPWLLAVPAFVAANLIQSALTGFCPAEILLRRLGTT